MGWATPMRIERVLGDVRSRWPDMPISLHLHEAVMVPTHSQSQKEKWDPTVNAQSRKMPSRPRSLVNWLQNQRVSIRSYTYFREGKIIFRSSEKMRFQ